MTYEIIPSPGTQDKDWPSIEKKIEIAMPFAATIHVDILDGVFTPNVTFSDPMPFKKFTGNIFLEVHLMVQEPINYLDQFAQAGFRRFIGQVEKMSNQGEFVRKAKTLGEIGLALDKQTPIDAIRVPFEDLDAVLIMTVQAGFSGQTFLPELLEKVKALRRKYSLPIEVDGGINDKTIKTAFDAGTTRFVATSFIYSHENPSEQFNILRGKLG